MWTLASTSQRTVVPGATFSPIGSKPTWAHVRIAAHQDFDHGRHREDPLERRGSRQDGAARERSARNTPVEGTPRELLKVIDQLVSAGRGALCIPGDNRRQGRGVDLRILRKAACVLD